jgi:hypothetical protein
MDAAHALYLSGGRSQVVYVRPGTYTENLVFNPGVSVAGLLGLPVAEDVAASLAVAPTVVVGEHTITEALGSISGGASNLLFLSLPSAGPLGGLVRYGTGGAPAGAGQFAFSNCIFDQRATGFDEKVFHTLAATTLNDWIHFEECTFWLKTATAIKSFDFLTNGTLLASWRGCRFSGLSSGRNALVAFPDAGKFVFTDCQGNNVRLVLGSSGSTDVDVVGCAMACGHGDTFAESDASKNTVTVKNSSITVKSPDYCFDTPMALALGASSFSGFTLSVFDESTVTPLLTAPLLHRGGVHGKTQAGAGTVLVERDVAAVFADTTSAAVTVYLPNPEALHGTTIRVFDTANSAVNNITVHLSSTTTELINVAKQVVTYLSARDPSSGAWQWWRVGEITP